MVALSNLISISITRTQSNVSRAGFGTPLILGETTTSDLSDNEVITVTSLDGVLDAGFVATDPEYLKANAYFAQSPRVESVKISKRQTPVAMVQTLDFDDDFVASNTIAGTVGGTAITPVPFNSDHATTLSDLAAAIQASSLVTTATVTGARQITVTAQTAGIPCTLASFTVTGGVSQPVATIATTTANVGVTEDLTAIELDDPDWYFLDMESVTQAELELAAAYIETKRKLVFFRTADTNNLDSGSTTDLGAVLEAGSYSRSVVNFNETNDDMFDSAYIGVGAPYDVGEISWAFKQPTGITGSNITETQYTDMLAKNVNAYVRYGNDNYRTYQGRTSDGTPIENIRGEDWIYARLQERVLERFSEASKVSFTRQGIAEIEAILTGVLQDAEKQGILSTDEENKFTITMPDITDVDAADKALGILRGIEFTAVFAGAIERVYFTAEISA